MNSEHKTKSSNNEDSLFVRMPKKIQMDYKNGAISYDERCILIWLFLEADYVNGAKYTSYQSISDDLNGKYSKNHINKIVLSLKRKKYLYFNCQKGRRGSFKISISNYPLPSGGFTSFESLSNKNLCRGQNDASVINQSELPEEVSINGQNLENMKKDLAIGFSPGYINKISRGSNNTNIKENKIIDNEKSFNEGIPVKGYLPRGSDEYRCKEIAIELGESDMRFLLSRLKKHGIGTIEKAHGLLKEEKAKGNIQNPRKYFNKLIDDESLLK